MKPDNSKEYWIKRAEAVVLLGEKSAAEVTTGMFGSYKATQNKIKKELESFYQKYAKDNQIDLAEVQKKLDPDELNTFHAEQKEYLKEAEAKAAQGLLVDPAHIASLKKQSAKAYVTKLDALSISIGENIQKLADTQAQDMEDMSLNHYEEVYFTTEAALSTNTGIGIGFDRVSEAQLKQAVQTKWVGGSFSDKIWANKNKLINTLTTLLPQEFVRGKGPSEVAKTMADQLNVAYSNANRLVRTEMNHISNRATLNAFKDTGIVDKYEYTATLDSRTSEVCMDLDGKTFLTKDAQAGVNMPPMHPYCRSTIIPFFPEDDLSTPTQRAARNAEGKTVVVNDKNYKDWLFNTAPQNVAKKQSTKWANYLTMQQQPALTAPVAPAAPPKPVLDFTQVSSMDWYQFANITTGDVDAYKNSTLYKKYNLDQYTPEEIALAALQKAQLHEVSASSAVALFSKDAFLRPYVTKETMRVAVNAGFVTKEEVQAEPLILDMKLNGLTKQQSLLKFLTGSAGDDFHDALYSEDGVTLKHKPEHTYQLLRKNMSAFAITNSLHDPVLSDDEMAHQLNTLYSIVEPKDGQAGVTFFGAASKKNAEYFLDKLYQEYKDQYHVVGVSAAYLDKFLKGKFATIADAKAEFKISHNSGTSKAKSSSYSFSSTSNFYQNTLDNLPTTEKDYLEQLKKDTVDPTPVSMADIEATSKTTKLFSRKEAADNVYRTWTSKVWKKISARHKTAAYEYTSGSGKFNRPLNGYKHSWGNYDPMVDLNAEGGKESIALLYDTIDQSPLPKSIKVRRGGSLSELVDPQTGILKQFANDAFALDRNKGQLKGQVVNIKNFLSTGVAEGAGFSGALEYVITLPAGTKAIYAEPFSAYGRSNGLHWDGSPDWKGSVGSEAEIIVQADTDYIVENLESGSFGWRIHLTAIPQSQHIDKAQDRLKNAVKNEVRK